LIFIDIDNPTDSVSDFIESVVALYKANKMLEVVPSFIAMSSLSTVETQLKFEESKCDFLVQKPLNADQVIGLINSL
jgi:polyhydroxyalkanoate synthesis regulator protein